MATHNQIKNMTINISYSVWSGKRFCCTNEYKQVTKKITVYDGVRSVWCGNRVRFDQDTQDTNYIMNGVRSVWCGKRICFDQVFKYIRHEPNHMTTIDGVRSVWCGNRVRFDQDTQDTNYIMNGVRSVWCGKRICFDQVFKYIRHEPNHMTTIDCVRSVWCGNRVLLDQTPLYGQEKTYMSNIENKINDINENKINEMYEIKDDIELMRNIEEMYDIEFEGMFVKSVIEIEDISELKIEEKSEIEEMSKIDGVFELMCNIEEMYDIELEDKYLCNIYEVSELIRKIDDKYMSKIDEMYTVDDIYELDKYVGKLEDKYVSNIEDMYKIEDISEFNKMKELENILWLIISHTKKFTINQYGASGGYDGNFYRQFLNDTKPLLVF